MMYVSRYVTPITYYIYIIYLYIIYLFIFRWKDVVVIVASKFIIYISLLYNKSIAM